MATGPTGPTGGMGKAARHGWCCLASQPVTVRWQYLIVIIQMGIEWVTW